MKTGTESNSYMQLCMHLEGKSPVYLRVPTLWDAVNDQWIGFIQTPESRKIISAKGKDSFELQNDFNVAISKFLKDKEMVEEVFAMFKPMEYWEARE